MSFLKVGLEVTWWWRLHSSGDWAWRPWWSFPVLRVILWLSSVIQQFFSQILSFSLHRQSSCFGSASPLLFQWVFSRYLHAGDSSWTMPVTDSQESVNPSVAQYCGSSSLRGFVVSGGKCPKFLVLNTTLNQNASVVLPAWEKVVLPWALFPFLRTDCILQTLVCAWHESRLRTQDR